MIYLLIILLISESICLFIHVQLVSLLQWYFVNAMIYLLIILSISELICQLVCMQLVSLLQRQTMIDLLIELINEWNKLYYVVDLNQKWVCFNDMINAMIYLFTSLYLSVNQSILSFCSTSESATKTLSMRWSIYSHHTSISHSESATLDISILHKTKKIHSCKHESLKRKE